MKGEKRQKLLSEMYERIKNLENGTIFSLEDLFYSTNEMSVFTTQKMTIMKTDLRKSVRFSDSRFRILPCDITEIQEDIYKKEKPVFHKVNLFSEKTPIQELFFYIKQTLITSISADDYFILSELFPGYVWKRLSQNQKVTLGLMFEDYNLLCRDCFARVAFTKQNQNIYRGLVHSQTKQKDSWEEVNVERIRYWDKEQKEWLEKIVSSKEKQFYLCL